MTKAIQLSSKIKNSILKKQIIDTEHPYKIKSNEAIKQNIIFRLENKIFKIDIHLETHKFQSHSKLYKWTDNGYALLLNKNPYKDFNHDQAECYKNSIDQNIFKKDIEYLEKIAEEFISIGGQE